MSTYQVSRKAKGAWQITHVLPGWINPLPNTYPTKTAAVTAARLLAGWAGKVTIAST